MWAFESVFYQIYPLGFCGAPFENDGVLEHRILKVLDWIPHMKELGVDAVYFSPLFESDTHGYNTRDYRKVDVRLGTNEDFKQVCDAAQERHQGGAGRCVQSCGQRVRAFCGCAEKQGWIPLCQLVP